LLAAPAAFGDICRNPTAHGDPSLKKAALLRWSDNNGSFGVTAITDRPFVLAIGQTFVSMRHATYFWKFGPRAKQGMRPLLAHEVRPWSIYGEVVLEVGRRLMSRL